MSDGENEKEKESGNRSAHAESVHEAMDVPAPRRRRGLRIVLLLLGPLAVVLVGAFIYVNTGRIVETDNAYVKAGATVVGAEVPGVIVDVPVRENQFVHKGDVLLKIDDSEYRIAVERARSQMDAVRSLISGLQASYQRGLEELSLARTNVAFAEREVAREESLTQRQLGSEADLDEARHELEIAQQQVPIIEQTLAQLAAQLGGATDLGIESHSAYRTAEAMLEDAKRNVDHTVVYAPYDGVVVEVPALGIYLPRGARVMGLVSTSELWIEANYKETELTHVAVGQPAVIRVDTYPGREWHGRVESISPATGSEFSVIPSQNASGNWVKVAQRITVRIDIENGPSDAVLRSGMSSIVEIDSGHQRELPPQLGFLSLLRL